MKWTISLVLFIICAVNAGAQRFLTNSGADNSILILNNVSKETLIGIGADLFFPKDDLAVTPNYISSIMNSSNGDIYKISGTSTKKEDCPNKEKLIGLCNSIFQRKEDDDPNSPYVYKYQRKIIEASCADMEKDSEEEISRKVNILWNKYENDLLTCDDANFNVSKGNILKLAVSRRFISVLEDAAQIWMVNLNRVDPSDQMTVLDYVRKEMKIHENSENEVVLKQYYDVLRKGGAKHANELKK